MKKDLNYELASRNEEFFRRIISQVEDYAILLIDTEGTILTWNKGAEKIKGYSSDEIIGKNYRIFYLPEDRERGLPEELLSKAINTGKVYHEGWRVRKDGTLFWGNITITAVHDENEELIGFLKVTRDLTERKIAEEERVKFVEDLKRKNEDLRKSEERYHNMVAEVQDYAIILMDEKGIILDWNKGAEQLKGYTSSEIVGKSFKIFYQAPDREAGLPDKLLNEAYSHGRVSHEGWRVKKDGTRFWGSVVISALHDHNGNVIGFTKVTRDLTERKLVEESLISTANALREKNRIVERLNEELTSFTYVASHDLKEPLRKISTYTSRLEDEKMLSQNGRTYLDKVRSSALRMQNLIDDLLYYSRVANEPLSFETLDLNAILDQVIADLEILITEKNATIIREDLPKIKGVAYQFQQLVMNLITNALKYSRREVPPVVKINYKIEENDQVNIEGNHKGPLHHISVEDNGIGFPPEYSQQIFNPFQRLHPKNAFSGTGIGLAIVKRVVDNHKGIVVAQGKPGEGAVFHIYLPETI